MDYQKYPEDYFELKKPAQPPETQNLRSLYSNTEISVYAVLAAVLLILIVIVCQRIAVYYIELDRNRRIAELAREIVYAEPAATPVVITPTPTPTTVPTPNPEPETEAEAETEPESEHDTEPEPEEPAERVILDKIINLREAFENDDIVSYVRIEGTNIDYAVVQASDNYFYLNLDLNRKKNTAGSLFLDYENNPEELDRNNIIYGHNMRNGSMFHNLRNYTDKAYFEEHRYIEYTTMYEETVWEIFSAYTATIVFNYIQVHFENDAEFETLIKNIKQKSYYDTGVEVGPEDMILTLSTCTNANAAERLVVSAKLIYAHKIVDE